MIRHIRGVVSDIEPLSVVVDVGGVGYLVHTSHTQPFTEKGTKVLLYTYLVVRETAMDLYGFVTKEELGIFELLITLPKIGPKSAQQILAQASIALLKEAVRNQDPSYLSKMSGIGKKSAEKIVAGLKEKFDASGIGYADIATETNAASNVHVNDTIDALIALGYSPQDARQAVQALPSDIQNANDAVRAALKSLSK